jgi:hypothetical protein
MMTHEDGDVIEAYLRRYRRGNKGDEDFWAWEVLQDMVADEPHKAFDLVLKLLQAASTKEEISFVAAGPLEDLLNYYGLKIIDKVKEEVRLNKRLRYAISMTIVGGSAITSVRLRLTDFLININ